MTKTTLGLLGPVLVVLAGAAAGCSASKPDSKIIPPTPTPFPLSRTNPNIVEEDEIHIVERFPKDQYIRVDGRRIRNPVIGPSVEFYKEDDKYYYVYTYKRTADTEAIERMLHPTPTRGPAAPTPTPGGGPPLSDFEDLAPARVSGRLRLEAVAQSGLPAGGLWRASFVMADVNGDGIPDIVAPAARLGEATLHVWIGDGKGGFSAWPLRFVEDGKPNPSFSIDYGGVAVGDIDGDGNVDIVSASHEAGLVSLFGDGKGTFRIVRAGLTGKGFSSQAIVLADADGDGKLDIVASSDRALEDPEFQSQIRVYLYRGARGWQLQPDGIVGGLYSNSLHAWDFDRDGRRDILTASHYVGGLTLLWKNEGNGQFSPVRFPEIEIYAFHFASAPGTFGKERVSAFADAYYMVTNEPEQARAAGITVYAFEKGGWTRHRVWRKKSGKNIQYALAMGDLDGDGLDDVVFPDSDTNRLRVFFQQPDGSFTEAAETEEPVLDSPGQCVRLVDLDGDGRLDVVLSKTQVSDRPNDPGGWSVYLNKRR